MHKVSLGSDIVSLLGNEGVTMLFIVSAFWAWNPWTCCSNRNQKNFIIWQFECDDEVSACESKRWDHVEFREFLSILPYRERVQPGLFIAVPQKVAAVTSIWEEKGLGRVACEVAVIPPGEERAVLSLRTNHRGLFLPWVFLSEITSATVSIMDNPETKLSVKTLGQGNGGHGWRGQERVLANSRVLGVELCPENSCWSPNSRYPRMWPHLESALASGNEWGH